MKDKGFHRDVGMVPGHPTKHPALHQPGQHHTDFQSRPFGADKGSNTHPEKIHISPVSHARTDTSDANFNSSRSHDPRPQHFHSNSGTSSEGHALIRRGGSVYRGARGTK